jgi:hypothetical protein
MVVCPSGFGINNDCADEGQQQYIGPTSSQESTISAYIMRWMNPVSLGTGEASQELFSPNFGEGGNLKLKTKLNSMVWVRERTIPTELPPLVGEVIANLCG